MTELRSWSEFLEALQPFLSAPSPLEAMTAAGFVFAGDVSRALERQRAGTVDPGVLQDLQSEYGPPPTLKLYVGRGSQPVRRQADGGYRATGSVELGVLNQIIVELWRVGTIPNSLDPSHTATLISISDLTAACNGVPADATGAVLYVTSPPIVAASLVSQHNVHVDVPFELLLNSATPTALVGTLGAELPLALDSSPGPADQAGMRLSYLTLADIAGLTVSLAISPRSTIQPNADGLAALNNKIAVALQHGLTSLSTLTYQAAIPAQVGLGSSFPNTQVRVTEAGALTVTSGGAGFAIAGLNVFSSPPNPSLFSSEHFPAEGNNFAIIFHEEFGSEILASMIVSGDLSAFLNRLVARHLPLKPAPFVVTAGSVTIESNTTVQVAVDVKWQGACTGDSDLDFSLTLLCGLTVDQGTVTIATSPVQVDISLWDEIECALVSIPIIGTVFTLIVELIANSVSSFMSGTSQSVSIGGTSSPLPGSEKVVQVEFRQLVLNPEGGTLSVEGQAQVIPDTARTFVYLRLMEGPTLLLADPLAGATVELLEIHDFAPIPQTGDRETFRASFEIDTSTSYQKLPDRSLGHATTDAAGYVNFAVICPEQAGILTTTTTTTDFHTHDTTTTSRQQFVVEGWSDLAITVATAAGTTLTTRRLVGTNIVDKRLGTRENPVVLLLHPLPLVNAGSPSG